MKAAVSKTIGKRPRMASFLHVLWTVTALAHVPFFLGMARLAQRLGWAHDVLFALAMTAAGVTLFLGRARAGMPDRRRSSAIVRFVDVPYYVHWCACLFTIIPGVVGTVILFVGDLVMDGVPTNHGDFYLAIYAIGFFVCAYGVLIRRRWFRVQRIDVPVTGLPKGFDGYRIAQLSDLHIGGLTPKSWGERWVRAANAEAPDMTVVTGDMVTSGTDFHPDITAVLGALKAKDGVVVTMGNHDYFGEGDPLVTMLRNAGVTVLRNEGYELEHDGERIYFAAIDDTWTRRASMEAALAARPEKMTALLLAHDPEVFTEAVGHEVGLVLSGHTHGGQIAMPFFARQLNLSSITHRFTLGLYHLGRSTLYVHPGLGTTGPPIRLGVAPAVVVLTLRAA